MTMMFCTGLPARVLHLRRAVLSLLALFAALALTACQPLIEVVQPAPAAMQITSPLATVTPDERGVAIMGVDFDPPLDAAQIISKGGVTLLVAIENHGQVAEPMVRVSARLYDPQDPSASGELVNETITERSLVPEEVRVVRFTQVTELPLRTHYKLIVEIFPVAGERERDDNMRTYDIIVHGVD